MPKAMVPRPTAARRRSACPPWMKWCQDSRKPGCAWGAAPRGGRRVSCFHRASRFSAMVATAAPWMTWIRRAGEKSSSRAPNSRALMIVPTSSITYISPTTFGCDSCGARSVASARPAVCTVFIPAPTSRNARPAHPCPTHAGQRADSPPPDRTSSANGMMAKPPNCSIAPFQMKGTRRQPSALWWVSDRWPIKARMGAASTGSEIITATSAAGTPSSTIITRLSVPTSSTRAMPTDTWNSDKRNSRDSGRSGEAASAKGRKRGPRSTQARISFRLAGFMVCAVSRELQTGQRQVRPPRETPGSPTCLALG